MVVHRRCKGVCLLQLQYVFLPLTFPPKFRGCPEEATEAFLPQTRNEGQSRDLSENAANPVDRGGHWTNASRLVMGSVTFPNTVTSVCK